MGIEQFVLVDYENVQPANLHLLRDHGFHVRIFVGAAQERIPLAMVSSLQVFGPALEYIQTSGIGPNALDFYIAYFLGRKSLELPHARFYVISHDTGFDPLMRHLRGDGLACRRVINVDEILSEHKLLEAMHALPVEQLLERAVNHLSRPAITRPRGIKSLRSTINALFSKKLSEHQIDNVILEMKNSGFVLQDSPRITYRLDQPGRHNSAATDVDAGEYSPHQKSHPTPVLIGCVN